VHLRDLHRYVNAALILALAGSFTGTLWRERRTGSAG